jgi:hypothetical protein
LFAALTLIATYPIVRAPASLAFFNHSDSQLNTWILAWNAHAIAHDPRNLFNANIFYPEPRTLAYSETLLGYLPIAGPILWLHGTPALAFNAVLLFSFAASGFSMYLLARHLTGRQWPAIVGGIVYAFLPYRFVHVPQIQLEAMEWMPATFLSLHLFLERRRFRYAAALAASVAMQALCCVYYTIFLAVALAAAVPFLLLTGSGGRRWRALATLAMAGALAGVIVAPIAGEYLHLHRAQGLERSLEEITTKSAVPETYLASPARLHQRLWASAERTPRDYLFPGIMVLALAFAAVIAAVRARDAGHETSAHTTRAIVITYGIVAVIGVLSSFGPDGIARISLFNLLYSVIGLLHGLRQVTRFAVLALFAVSVLAAIGAATIEAPLRRLGRFAPAVLVCCAFLELLVMPLTADRPGGEALVRVPPTPPVYTWLAKQPDNFAILELPYAPPGLEWQNGSYVYWSTVHWHGVVDAYSGFAPPTYPALAAILKGFPDELSREALTLRHVRYVIIHHDRYKWWNTPLDYDLIRRTPWLTEVQQFPAVDVLEVQPSQRLLTRATRDR